MHLRFEIDTLADAQRSAAVCQNIVMAFGGEVPPVAPRATRVRTHADCGAAAEVAAPIDTAPLLAKVSLPAATNNGGAASAFNRAEVESDFKERAIERGIVWIRENVFKPYNVRKPSDLTDDQLKEVVAKMDSEPA